MRKITAYADLMYLGKYNRIMGAMIGLPYSSELRLFYDRVRDSDGWFWHSLQLIDQIYNLGEVD